MIHPYILSAGDDSPKELRIAVEQWDKVRGHPLMPAAAVDTINQLLTYIVKLEARVQSLEKGATNNGNSNAPDSRKN